MGRTMTIEINCSMGDFDYSDRSIRLNRGDVVRWVCKDPKAHFAIHIGWNSPFSKCRYRAGPGGVIEIEVPNEASMGCYKYHVAVFDGREIWTDDPEFIIRG